MISKHTWLMIQIVLFACFMSLCVTGATLAQAVRTKEIRSRLDTVVKLELGNSNVAEVMESLSKQTGTAIKAEPYLERHKIYVSISKLSAAQALSSISEMNQWRWVENSRGEIILTHLFPMRPTGLSEFTEAFMKTFPVAWRPFLGLDLDYSRLITEEMLTDEQKAIEAMQKIKEPDIREKVLNDRKNSLHSDALHNYRQRYHIAMGDEPLLVRLFPAIRSEFASGKPIPYSKWTDTEKNAVMRVSILNALSRIDVGNPLLSELLSGSMRDYIQFPEKCSIAIERGGLFLGEAAHNPDGNPKSGKMLSFVGHSLEFLERKND